MIRQCQTFLIRIINSGCKFSLQLNSSAFINKVKLWNFTCRYWIALFLEIITTWWIALIKPFVDFLIIGRKIEIMWLNFQTVTVTEVMLTQVPWLVSMLSLAPTQRLFLSPVNWVTFDTWFWAVLLCMWSLSRQILFSTFPHHESSFFSFTAGCMEATREHSISW